MRIVRICRILRIESRLGAYRQTRTRRLCKRNVKFRKVSREPKIARDRRSMYTRVALMIFLVARYLIAISKITDYPDKRLGFKVSMETYQNNSGTRSRVKLLNCTKGNAFLVSIGKEVRADISPGTVICITTAARSLFERSSFNRRLNMRLKS